MPRDWILLFIPIFFNGVLIFALQKRFEKRQFGNSIKRNHILGLLAKVDKSILLMSGIKLYLHNSSQDSQFNANFAAKITNLHEQNVDTYFWIEQNENTFRFLEKETAYLKELINWFAANRGNRINTSSKLEELYETLQKIKTRCENVKI